MISHMTTARPQQRYDHRLRELVQRTGNLSIAADLGVPRSTARGWLRTAPSVVVGLEAANLTRGAAPARTRPAALLRVHLVRRPTARRSRQAADAAGHRSGPRLHPAAGGPAAPPAVAESVPRVATAPHGVCSRRSVVLSAHVAASTDASGNPGHRGHGDVDQLPSRSQWDARGPGPTARHGLGFRLDLVPPCAEIRLATAPTPRALRETQDGTSHHST